jgi:hypothetical protein
VDVEVHELELEPPDGDRRAIGERAGREDQRVDRRRPVERAGLDGRPVAVEERRRASVRDDLAVREGALVPATWSRCRWLRTTVKV